MTVTYSKAPLVELIAELRWGEALNISAGDSLSAIQPDLPTSKDEEIYMQFGAAVSAIGYGRFERVLPPGFPRLHGHVVCRYRPTNPSEQAPLFQLGPGVFTANALPPYKSWASFSPVVRKGIDCLFKAYDVAQMPAPAFNAVLVRYIDAFGDDLTAGRNVQAFLREVMGLNIVLPDVLLTVALDANDIQPLLHLAIPVSLGRLEIKIAEGKKSNERAIMLDTAILIQNAIGSNADAAMQALTEGRQLIHDLFRGLTKPIHVAMSPIP